MEFEVQILRHSNEQMRFLFKNLKNVRNIIYLF